MAVGIALFFGTILAMEAVAYGAHRWVMHGPGWFLHESHHRHREGLFELNDLYALIFAIPSIVLLLRRGAAWAGASWAVWVGAGIAGLWRDLFRLPRRHRPSAHRPPLRRAFVLHEADHPGASAAPRHEGKHGSVSFGFLWAPPADMLKRQLGASEAATIRAPRR